MIAKQRPTPAAVYIRMSGCKQELSPGQQRAEIKKLARRFDCEIVREFIDEAICGDSGPDKRRGLAGLLRAAERGEFKVLLAWDQDRIGRFDSLDAGRWLAPLRTAGIRIVTCAQGEIDLSTFAGRLVYSVTQEGKKQYVVDLSRNIVRGALDNAKLGYSNGGTLLYGFKRVLVRTSDGQVVRELAPGEFVRMDGHKVRTVPGDDEEKLSCVRWLFKRFATADVSFTKLAAEAQAKGYPSPDEARWTFDCVGRILRNPAYAGGYRWNQRSYARYHNVSAGEIAPVVNGGRKGLTGEPIVVKGVCKPVVAPKLFRAVQIKLQGRVARTFKARASYPCSRLLWCKHCGQPLVGSGSHYVCKSYSVYGAHNPAGCAHYTLPSTLLHRWLAKAIREALLGTDREALAAEIRRQLSQQAKDTKGDAKRLQGRLEALEGEIRNLVSAVRLAPDVSEVVKELEGARQEREAIKAQLGRNGDGAGDLDVEAERLADELWTAGENLIADADPAVVREALRRFVQRIECRWALEPWGTKGKQRARLVEGVVFLRPGLGVENVRTDAHASAYCRKTSATSSRGPSLVTSQ